MLADHPSFRTRTLPHQSSEPFLTDGGLETSLIFHDGIELPLFAAFVLLEDPTGREALKAYYRRSLAVAAEAGVTFILESPTWRCSRDWGAKLGYSANAVSRLNRDAIQLMTELRETSAAASTALIAGCIGPRDATYLPELQMDPDEAAIYHAHQIAAFRMSRVDLVTAIAMTHAGEAIGLARAAQLAGLTCAISFTVGADGRLPSGQPLGAAITQTDAATRSYPAYYMVNCAHPGRLAGTLPEGAAWLRRIRGVLTNPGQVELGTSAPLESAPGEQDHGALARLLPNLNVFGGGCGADPQHVQAIAERCLT